MIETICHIKKPRKPVCRKIKPSRHFRVGYQPSIPSIFYEYNKERFCNDDQTKEEIVVEYEDWLRNSDKPRQQMRTTSELTKAFGITELRQGVNYYRRRYSGQSDAETEVGTNVE